MSVVELNDKEEVVASDEKKGITFLSLLKFRDDVNSAIDAFQTSNPEVTANELMPAIFNVFLTFPYTWFAAEGQSESFVDVISSEAVRFHKMVKASKEADANLVDGLEELANGN